MSAPVLPLELQPEAVQAPPSACPHCGDPCDALAHPRCGNCEGDLGKPNVLAASTLAQQDALRDRVLQSLQGASPAALRLGQLARTASARINVSVRFASQFLSSDRELYLTYAKAVAGGVRRPAAPEDDQVRRQVDARLFGWYGDELRFGALGLYDSGVPSYGPVTLVLRDSAVAARASLMEENAFAFYAHHDLGRIERTATGYRHTHPEPPGYRACWPRKHLLAVAKLAPRLTAKPGAWTDDDLSALLLEHGAARSEDELIEVHIYGPLSRRAVERVLLWTGARGVSDLDWRLLKDRLAAHNGSISWKELP